MKSRLLVTIALLFSFFAGSFVDRNSSVEESSGLNYFQSRFSLEAQIVPTLLQPPLQFDVPTVATALPDSGRVAGVSVQGITDGPMIYVGTTSSLSTSNGWPLGDGSSISPGVSNANQLYVISSSAGQRVAIWYWRR